MYALATTNGLSYSKVATITVVVYMSSRIRFLHPDKKRLYLFARTTRRTTGDRPYEAISECRQIPNLSHVYSGRSLLPAKFTGLHVSVVNMDSRPQILRKKTNLGELELANIVESHSETETVDDDSTGANIDVVQQMMEWLPT